MTTLCTVLWAIAQAIFWAVILGAAYLAISLAVGILIGRGIRGRDHHYPSPNHPTMRAHKQHVDDRPLDPYEAAAWKQLEEKLR